jgi:hypothetical protein
MLLGRAPEKTVRTTRFVIPAKAGIHCKLMISVSLLSKTMTRIYDFMNKVCRIIVFLRKPSCQFFDRLEVSQIFQGVLMSRWRVSRVACPEAHRRCFAWRLRTAATPIAMLENALEWDAPKIKAAE